MATTLNWPGFGIASVSWTLDRPAQVNRSSYTGVRAVATNPWHGKWSAKVQLAVRQGDGNFQVVRQFFSQLKGQVNNFHLPAVEQAQNGNSGVTTQGTATAGDTLMTLTGVTTALVVGNMITYKGQLLSVVAVGSLAAGVQSTTFEPPLRVGSSAGTAVETAKPYALVALTTSSFSWDIASWRQYGLTFEVDEAIGDTDGADPSLDIWTGGISSGGGGGGGGGTYTFPQLASFTTRALLAAVPSPVDKQVAYLTEIGRQGTFVFSTAPVTALVTADTAQGIYVAPASDTTGASGAWVRQTDGTWRAEWFGAIGDYTGTIGPGAGTGTDNVPTWTAIMSLVAAVNLNGVFVYRAGIPIKWLGPSYYFSTALDLKARVNVIGAGSSSGAAGAATRFIFAANQAGIRGQRYNTIGETTATGTYGADGSIINDIAFESLGGTPNVLKSGVWMRCRMTVRDCSFRGFPGCGILIYATSGGGGSTEGNANGWLLDGAIRVTHCLYGGVWVQGADANAGSSAGAMLDIADCARYGLNHRPFLGNTIGQVQCADCGDGNAGGLAQTSIVSDGTYQYRLVDGQDASAAGTAPTTRTNNAVWLYEGPGAASSFAPLWSTYVAGGGSFVSGGGTYGGGGNSRTPFIGLYSEGGEAGPLITPPDFVVGGLCGQGYLGKGPHILGSGDGMINQNGWYKQYVNPTGIQISYGVGHGDETTILFGSHSTYATTGYRVGFGAAIGNPFESEDIFTSVDGNVLEKITCATTGEQGGTGAALKFTRHIFGLLLGTYNNGGARMITYGSAAPTSGAHGLGEIVFNNGGATAITTTSYWQCTAAGTPGTWAAHA